MVKEYVLDANAVLIFLYGGHRENPTRVRRLVEAARSGEARLFISAINLGEVFYVLRKTRTEDEALQLISSLDGIASFVEISQAAAIQAAEMKYRYKLGYADCFAARLAMDRKATLVSADPSFDKLGKSIKWLKLSRHGDSN